uniref:Uncharacterized protein n=1 Tax=Cacopsylla melanoneura TaxID=428564 RepID=A0A8D9EC58_9HEMI
MKTPLNSLLLITVGLIVLFDARAVANKISDESVKQFLTERTCWWNEVCKEEFQSLFRCRCPQWSFCRSPGRYYNAFCSMTGTGYIWAQPDRVFTLPRSLPLTN